MFQTRGKYSKHVVNVSTALYSQRVANSRKNNNTRQVSATVIQDAIVRVNFLNYLPLRRVIGSALLGRNTMHRQLGVKTYTSRERDSGYGHQILRLEMIVI